MINHPLFSIIVPIYNGEAYIGDCITSVTQQTFSDYELILINDGSTDNSLSVIRKLAANDRRVKIIDKQNAGVSAARNDGLARAAGQYILFVDVDDYLFDVKALEKLATVVQSDADLVLFRAHHENAKNTPRTTQQRYTTAAEIDTLLCEIIKTEQLNASFNKVYKKQLIDRHQLRFDTNLKIGEDLLFVIGYMQQVRSVYRLDDFLYFYRTTNMQSATKTYMPNKYHDLLHVNDAMRSWVTTRHNKQLTNIVTYIRIKNILSCLRDLHHAGSTLSKQEARQRAQSYKADNPRLFVRGCGLQLAVMSWLYSALSGAVLSKLIGYIYGGKS